MQDIKINNFFLGVTFLTTTTCMNVDILTAQATCNTNIAIQLNVPPVVTHMQAHQCKCAFVGGLGCFYLFIGHQLIMST